MLTLSYGFKKPQDGDRGNVFFPALADDVQQLNDHNHDGANSAKLTAASSTVLTSNIPSGSWGALGNGVYRQLITLPGALKYDEVMISTKGDPNGHIYYLEIEKVSATTFYVYTNDNSLAFKAVYTS